MMTTKEKIKIIDLLRTIGVEDHLSAILKVVENEKKIAYNEGRQEGLIKALEKLEFIRCPDPFGEWDKGFNAALKIASYNLNLEIK